MAEVFVCGRSLTGREKSREVCRYIRRTECTNERESEALQSGPVSFLVEAEQEDQEGQSPEACKTGVRAGQQSETPKRNEQRSHQSDRIELFLHFL